MNHLHPPLLLSWENVAPRIASTAFVAPGVVIVGDVTIGADSSIWFGAVVRGDEHPVVIGERTNIQDLSVCHETGTIGPLIVGNDVTVGHRALLHGCTIGDRCLIGMGAIVLDGAQIGAECIVAAGAVVREGMIVPPRSLVVGMPAQVKRPIDDNDLARILHAAGHYVMRSRQYSDLCR